MSSNQRPELTLSLITKDFAEYYWLKTELTSFCKKHKLPTSGSKKELTNRIAHFLETGKVLKKKSTKSTTSTFDWNTETLSNQTVITDNYHNSQNVRAFFTEQIGPNFRFSVVFMNWMKVNMGKTLAEAILAWKEIAQLKKTSRSTISPQFEYNQFFRDFFEANPDKTRKEAVMLWNIVKQRKGKHVYRKSDLELLKP